MLLNLEKYLFCWNVTIVTKLLELDHRILFFTNSVNEIGCHIINVTFLFLYIYFFALLTQFNVFCKYGYGKQFL